MWKSKSLDAKLCEVVKRHSGEHEHLKNLINMIKESNDEEVDNFHDCNEALNKTNTLAIKVLQLNLCQYLDTSN